MISKSAKATSLASKCGCQEKSVVYKTECRRVADQNKGLGEGEEGVVVGVFGDLTDVLE